jgi:Zn finger protein HypA/HybF involved in hydrogenase expression
VPVSVVCRACGNDHQLPDRAFDPETGTTSCPACGERPFTVRHEGLVWHPDRDPGSRSG